MRRAAAPIFAVLVPTMLFAQQTRPKTPPVTFNYVTLDGAKASTESAKGRVVVLAFVRDGADDWRAVKDAANAIAGVEAVAIYVGKDRRQAEQVAHDCSFPFPVAFDEKRGNQPVANHFGITAFPFCIVLDPDGREAARVGLPQLGATLARQVELTPPRTVSREVVSAAEEKLTLAEWELKGGKPWSAARYLSQLPPDAAEDAGIGKRVSEATLALDAQADALIAETEKLIADGKLGEAVVKLEELAAALKRSPVLGKVEDQLHSVTDDPDLKRKVEEQRPAVAAGEIYDTAMDYDARVARAKAYVMLSGLVKKMPATPAAAEAKATLAKWESDPAERRKLRDALVGDQANSLFSRAENLRNSTGRDRAKSLYEQVIRDFPGTTAAERAAEVLKAWK